MKKYWYHVTKHTKTYKAYHCFVAETIIDGPCFRFDDCNKIRYTYAYNHHKSKAEAEYTQPIYSMKDNWDNWLTSRHTQMGYIYPKGLIVMCYWQVIKIRAQDAHIGYNVQKLMADLYLHIEHTFSWDVWIIRRALRWSVWYLIWNPSYIVIHFRLKAPQMLHIIRDDYDWPFKLDMHLALSRKWWQSSYVSLNCPWICGHKSCINHASLM